MTGYAELGHSSYLISKAQARIRTQRRAVEQARISDNPRMVNLGLDLIALMEQRLVVLLSKHREIGAVAHHEVFGGDSVGSSLKTTVGRD